MFTKNTQNKKNSPNKKNIAMSNSIGSELVKNYVMGIGITNAAEKNILEYIVENVPKQLHPYYIVTPNPEMVVLATKDKAFKTILNNAQIALCDGMQLYRAAMFLGVPLKERIIGTNFVEKLCEKVADQPITVGFLGGRADVAEAASECLREKFSGLKITFAKAEWVEGMEMPTTDILFVAFGFPKQEKWMAEHVGKIPVKVLMGVGGAFDQIVHPSLRPPAVIHQAGLGWMYRLARQPWRVKRQAKLVEFLQLVGKAKLTQS